MRAQHRSTRSLPFGRPPSVPRAPSRERRRPAGDFASFLPALRSAPFRRRSFPLQVDAFLSFSISFPFPFIFFLCYLFHRVSSISFLFSFFFPISSSFQNHNFSMPFNFLFHHLYLSSNFYFSFIHLHALSGKITSLFFSFNFSLFSLPFTLLPALTSGK